MANMNSRKRKRLYTILAQNYGEMCQRCKAGAVACSLVIDHIDNDNRNNQLSNLQLLCRGCNYRKNPRVQKDHSPVRERKIVEEYPMGMELRLKLEKEPAYRKWIEEVVRTEGFIELDRAIDGGSERIGLGQQTLKRYLRAMTSVEGLYEVVKDEAGREVVKLKIRTIPIHEEGQRLIERARQIVKQEQRDSGSQSVGPSP